jgi:hypothetical protein
MLELPLLQLICGTCVPVAQLDRASACGAEGRRFESCRVHQIVYAQKASQLRSLFIC